MLISAKRKVLLVSPYANKKVGGIGTWTKNVLKYEFIRNNFDVDFLNTALNFKSNLVINNITRIFLGIFDSISILCLLLVKIISYNPDTIHYTSSASYALIKDLLAVVLAKGFRIRIIIHWRFGRIPELAKKKNAEWKLLVLITKLSDSSIVLDNHSLTVLNQNSIFNVVLIPNPISQELYRKSISISSNQKILKRGCFVFVGHIIRAKGVYELIEACSKIVKVNQLLLIGPVLKNVQQDLMAIASKRNNGKWLEWKGEIEREDVLQFLYSANALCLPSYSEGFPNVVIEAMSLGCPVIATRVGAIEEMLLSDDYGDAGICIETKNTTQLENAIEYFIENPKIALNYGINGNKRVLGKYTLANIFPKYEELW